MSETTIVKYPAPYERGDRQTVKYKGQGSRVLQQDRSIRGKRQGFLAARSLEDQLIAAIAHKDRAMSGDGRPTREATEAKRLAAKRAKRARQKARQKANKAAARSAQ